MASCGVRRFATRNIWETIRSLGGGKALSICIIGINPVKSGLSI